MCKLTLQKHFALFHGLTMEGSLPAFNRLVFLPNRALQGIVYQQSQLTGKASVGWRLVNVISCFSKGGSRQLQACHNLGTREGCGADHFECHHTAHTGRSSDQKQPACSNEMQVLPDSCDLLQQADLLTRCRKGCGCCLPVF